MLKKTKWVSQEEVSYHQSQWIKKDSKIRTPKIDKIDSMIDTSEE